MAWSIDATAMDRFLTWVALAGIHSSCRRASTTASIATNSCPSDIGGSAGFGSWACYAADTWSGTPGRTPCYSAGGGNTPCHLLPSDRTSAAAKAGGMQLLGVVVLCAAVGLALV